jgi:hypothetical protein
MFLKNTVGKYPVGAYQYHLMQNLTEITNHKGIITGRIFFIKNFGRTS